MKTKRSLFNKYFRVMGLMEHMDHHLYVYAFLLSLFKTVKPYVSLFFTSQILNELLGQQRVTAIQGWIAAFVGSLFVLNVLTALFTKLDSDVRNNIDQKLEAALAKKSLTMDYASFCDPMNRLNFKKAEEGSQSNGGIAMFSNYVIQSFFAIIISAAISFSAITVLVMSRSTVAGSLGYFADSWRFVVLLVLLLIIPIVSTLFLLMKSANLQRNLFEEINDVNREMSYYESTVLASSESGKMIRLYGAAPLIIDIVLSSTRRFIKRFGIGMTKVKLLEGSSQMMTYLSIFALYGLIGVKVMSQAIEIGSVLFYVGTLQAFISSLVDNITQFSYANLSVHYLQYYIDYLELPESSHEGKSIKDEAAFEISFNDVYFCYPGSTTPALHHFNLVIHGHEKLAVVGRNGMGKTTFIKLLCRFYQPDSGTITLNGVDIQTLQLDEYLSQLGVVFQDFRLFAFSIAQNIAGSEHYDEARVMQALQLAGLYDRVQRLPLGINTVIKQQLDDDGVELSGGEAQKLAIARAWYTESKLIILDEPTAALDPVSEYEIYRHFDELVADHSAIYISHRMSSCRFCERIIVIDHGEVIQEGNHEQLMNEQNSLYYELFTAQAQYYQA